MWKKIISIVLIFSIFSLSIFAEDNTPEKYDTSELPQSLKDFRRFEIITLGSLPFITLDTTLAYSAIMRGTGRLNYKGEEYTITPFASDSCFSWEEDQSKIIGISIAICVGIGLTDLIVRIIKRSSKTKKAMRTTSRDILITPVSEDPDAMHIDLPGNRIFTEEDFEIDSEIEVEEVDGE